MCILGGLFLDYHFEHISWVELSVNKQIRLNCVLSLHLDLQYTVSFRKKHVR